MAHAHEQHPRTRGRYPIARSPGGGAGPGSGLPLGLDTLAEATRQRATVLDQTNWGSRRRTMATALDYAKWDSLADSSDDDEAATPAAHATAPTTEVSFNDPAQLLAKGNAQYGTRSWLAARDCFERALLLPTITGEQRLRCHLNTAAACIELKDYQVMQLHAKAACGLDPAHGRALQMLEFATTRWAAVGGGGGGGDDQSIAEHKAKLEQEVLAMKGSGNEAFRAGAHADAIRCPRHPRSPRCFKPWPLTPRNDGPSGVEVTLVRRGQALHGGDTLGRRRPVAAAAAVQPGGGPHPARLSRRPQGTRHPPRAARPLRAPRSCRRRNRVLVR